MPTEKLPSVKAIELLNSMLRHLEGPDGGVLTKIAALQAMVVADEMISHLDVDGIAYWGRYWRYVKIELKKYIHE
jgi:hypothetical protein